MLARGTQPVRCRERIVARNPACKALLFVHIVLFEVGSIRSRELAWRHASEESALIK